MTCKECGAKISAKHYDPEFEMYDCPKCGHAWEPRELAEPEPRKPVAVKSTRDGKARNQKAPTGIVAAGKKRRAAILEDEEAGERQLADMAKTTVHSQESTGVHHRDELPTEEVVNVFADEIQLIYGESGLELDYDNSRDKALILWRALRYECGITARDQETPIRKCKAHAA